MISVYLSILLLLPVLVAVCLALGPESPRFQGRLAILATFLPLLCMVLLCFRASAETLAYPLVGLSFTFGGFQKLYGMVVCFMWFVSALLSPQYFRGHHHLKRYYFFFLICLSFTQGVFLSADLYTTFLFFELMSLGSYVWVVQEETDGALAAGRTYLSIAVLGGLVTLMGLFLLYHLTGTLALDELAAACAAVENRRALWAAAVCILFGFGAKAGVFPLHIWLPKAHPVAPAPASALLSGVLTKAGVFGMLIITAHILPFDHRWGVLVLVLGCITMVLGAVMAVFSINLKFILACSSLSQIGFILVGVSMICLLGSHNALAANGTVLYMLNHSLVKLTLFLLAGVVYYNTHQLDLNRIRGFGRRRLLLHVLFLFGACSLAGIPGTLGYLSKTLVHEAVVELAVESGSAAITAVEWLFLLSGGLTAAYMTKVYVALFWQKAPEQLHSPQKWGAPASVLALILAAVPLPVLGLLPHRLAEKISGATLSFTAGHPFDHAIHYFAWANLKGVVISLTIGLLVYLLFIRRVLIKGGVYRSCWPDWLSLEDRVYLPIISLLFRGLRAVCRVICDSLDLLVLLCRRTFLRDWRERINAHPYSQTARAISHHISINEEEVSDRIASLSDLTARMTNSVSFGLLTTCMGLCLILVVALIFVFA